jgi:hypothetical protein
MNQQESIPQVGGWVGIVDGQLLLVRTYADETVTVAIRNDERWGPEVELEVAP